MKDKIARKAIEEIRYGKDPFIPSLMELQKDVKVLYEKIYGLSYCLSEGHPGWVIRGGQVACQRCGMLNVGAEKEIRKIFNNLNNPKQKG
jgi:hypothetical protein